MGEEFSGIHQHVRRPYGRACLASICFAVLVTVMATVLMLLLGFNYGMAIDASIVQTVLMTLVGHFILAVCVALFLFARMLRIRVGIVFIAIQAIGVWLFFACLMVYWVAYQFSSAYTGTVPGFYMLRQVANFYLLNASGLYLLGLWVLSTCATWALLRLVKMI